MPRDEGRYEPLPPITGLPAFVWRRLSRAGRIVVAALGVAALAGIAVAIPQLRDARRDADVRAEREEAAEDDLRIERLRRLVAPRTSSASGMPPRVLARLREDISADAARRTGDRILRVDCERLAAAEAARSTVRGAKLRCLAVTADFAPSEATTGGSLGHPYRAVADFRTGRLTYCRVFGVPGEGGLTSRRAVTVPAECGG